jgi:DNA repair protein RecN (Recombination protein N)
VLDYGRDAARRAEELTALSEEADLIEERVNRATLEVDQKAGTLREARKDAAHRLVSAAGDQLGALAMGRALLEMRIDAIDPGPEGADRAELWFASDPRLDPAPLSAVASGGELSRLVLAVRLAARRPGSTTLVFDEVDAGVGGATALALGRMLAELGNTCQVLCVTHLAQIAAQGDAHYAIERDGPVATARLVTGDERLAELARMIAGSPESAPGRRTARELLESAKAG